MEKEFIPYEQALALKELGFNEPCIGFWWNNKDFTEPEFLLEYCEHVMDGNLKRPLYQQAFRWFREKYPELDFGVAKIYNGTNNYHYHINLRWEFFEGTYEEAELACLKKLIEIVKNK